MANAQVEKLKALGLRHGEKAVVGLAAALCLLFLVSAVIKPTTPLTPEQVASDAKAADSNLARPQPREDILKRLEDQGLKDSGYEKLVDEQAKTKLDAVAYKVPRPWVTPEPGAGLIRDMPELLAPTELYAYPGRGGALIFALDDDGKRILDDKKDEDSATKARRGRKRRRSRRGGGGGYASMMGSGPSMSGMMGGGGGGGPETEKQKQARLRREKALKAQLVGKEGAEPPKDKEKEKADEGAEPQGPFKEITKGLRWVAITGVLDHKTMRANYLSALKNPAAQPNYKQLDIQRQVRQPDGSWGDWEDVDAEKNREITFNLPEEEEELTPDDVRIDALVDPLPFLKAGYWEKVHVVSLVPKEKREVGKPQGSEMMGGMMGGMMAAGSPSGGYPGASGGMSGGAMNSAMMGGMMGSGGMMGGGSMGGGDEGNYQKTEADTVMIRALDFTTEPDTTYRFRLRIAVYNPNYHREDVNPGVDTNSLELKGPWSEPTEAVTMPADVTAYAMRKYPAGPKRSDQVEFQVVRWEPESGVTVTRLFNAGPGEVIGELATTPIPNSDGNRRESRPVDYNSHQLVVDTAGGPRPIAPVGATGAPLDMPALSLMMRPDGSVLVRNEAYDSPDPVRKDMDENYKRELKETGKRRESSMGSMYSGMMGGMMGAGPR